MLELEYQTYCERKEELVRQGEGKYVVIAGADVVGLFDEFEDALEVGYTRFGPGRFMAKLVEADDRRWLVPRICRTSPSK
jgi:hypothetical protein